MCMSSLPTCLPVNNIRAAPGRPEEGARGLGTEVGAISRMLQTEPGPSTRVTCETSLSSYRLESGLIS